MGPRKSGGVLSETSKITVSLCLAIVSLSFWTGIAWAQIGELTKRVNILELIDRRLSRIEGKLGVGE